MRVNKEELAVFLLIELNNGTKGFYFRRYELVFLQH